MKIQFFFAVAIPLLFGNVAHAWTTSTSDNVWRSGWGQGTAEAEVTHGSGNNIYVACQDGSLINSSITISLAGKGPNGNSILMVFDAGNIESISVNKFGSIESDSRSGDATFRYVIDRLKKHKTVLVRFGDGRESTFTLNGASKAIGNCKSTFPSM